MLANNNKPVIMRMAIRSLKSNGRRSIIILMAIALSTFMLFTIFTIGSAYFRMQKTQNIKLDGGDYDAIMYGVTKEQQEMCKNNPSISAIGVIGLAGSALETEADDTVNMGLAWADNTFWNIMMAPAREWTKGEYPQKSNEIMVTKKALQACGMEKLGIGDSFPMVYSDFYGEHTKKFKISGIWEGYGTKIIYVSEAFYEECGYELSSVRSGRYYMNFESKLMPLREQEAFIDSMKLEKQQTLLFNSESRTSVLLLFGMLGVVLITCFCAYLLIYNILYLSVSGNIRYYGLLQTVGMTGKQIYKLMQRQMLTLGFFGVGGGLIAGGVVSFLMIPIAVQSFGIQASITAEDKIAFSPLILLATILLTSFTIYLGSRKPVKMAVHISPIEALGYRQVSQKKNHRKIGRGQILWKMAMDQLTSDKKKTTIVILSLTISLSVFLCLVTLVESQGARTMVSNFMNSDMTIYNEKMGKSDREDWKQVLDDKFIAAIKETQGVEEVYPFLSAEIIVPWEPDFADMWMEEFYAMWMEIPYKQEKEEYMKYPEKFGSFVIGIEDEEFDFLNETLSVKINKEDFISGKTCVLHRSGLDFKDQELIGKKVNFAEYSNSGNEKTLQIAGVTSENYYTASLHGYPPTIIVSAAMVKNMIEDPYVYKIGVRYEQEFDEEAEADLLKLVQTEEKDLFYDSKIEELHAVEKTQGHMMEIGVGIILIIGVMGVLNYVNTVIGNLQNRRMKLAILESLGMTNRQIKRMLVIEGLLFSGISLFLTATFGMGITYILYQMMNYRGIPFGIPIWPNAIMALFIIAVCTIVPVVIRNALEGKNTTVEEIKGFE